MDTLIIDLLSKVPGMVEILVVVGTLRLVNKPLFSLIRSVVDSTPTKKDNEVLDKVESSGIYKTFTYVLDWFGSVKIEPKK